MPSPPNNQEIVGGFLLNQESVRAAIVMHCLISFLMSCSFSVGGNEMEASMRHSVGTSPAPLNLVTIRFVDLPTLSLNISKLTRSPLSKSKAFNASTTNIPLSIAFTPRWEKAVLPGFLVSGSIPTTATRKFSIPGVIF